MSLEAWGDEGNIPSHGRDTDAFRELNEIRDRLHKWARDFKSELGPDEVDKSGEALERIDEVLEILDVPL